MLLFLFSLFNVHPLGGLIGLSIHSLKINKIKVFYTGFLSAISITSILWQINNDDIQFMSGTIEASYGIQYFINRFTSLNIYLGLVISLLIIFISTYKKQWSFNQILKSKYYETGYVDVLIYWFLFTSLFFNNAYRLPIFFLIFILLNQNKDTKIRIFNLIFVSFAVSPFYTDFVFFPLFWIIKIIAFFFLFSYLFSYFMNDSRTILFKQKWNM